MLFVRQHFFAVLTCCLFVTTAQRLPGLFDIQAWTQALNSVDLSWDAESLRRTVQRGGPLSLLANLNPFARFQMSLFPQPPPLQPPEITHISDSELAVRILKKARHPPKPLTRSLKHNPQSVTPFELSLFTFKRLSNVPTPDEIRDKDLYMGFFDEGGFIDLNTLGGSSSAAS